jgi:sigma-B regulation protein RsbQ
MDHAQNKCRRVSFANCEKLAGEAHISRQGGLVVNVAERFNINLRGRGTQPMLFAHGYGGDQSMWRWVAPAFEQDYRVILFDLAGSGHAHPSAYNRIRHATLRGYARDVLEIIAALDLKNVVFVGHAVSAILGVLAAIERPEPFARLILVGASPCYIDGEGYAGGFAREDIDGLIDAIDNNAQPDMSRAFARVTFLSDNRADLARVSTRTLILQATDDVIAPVEVGRYMHASLRESELVLLEARGHCPHMSEPARTIAAMQRFLSRDADHA